MDFFINFIVIALFIFPIIALIHESGHAFFLKIYGGKISDFSIGNGDIFWSKNNFNIRKAYFLGGKVTPENLEVLSKYQKTLFILGGVVFNFLSALILHLLTDYEFLVFRSYIDSFIFVSYLNVVINLIPLNTIIGFSDGKQLGELYKS
ncbi:site-2 protease family protein [Filibacter tadaridae]|uniref:Peptidase family M50 n=1 Tax=Filibacter tadaridae TaxID=2483811 RepID=A0A3P5Y0E0_9BACL|nr:site-2 protease family protein [Filibacter tadaridae]VDC33907.1 Peptidase family M50 [Filibacter tadaridae]